MLDRMEPDGSEIPLSQLAKRLSVHYTTVLDWALNGRKGVQLRVCQHPNGYASSMEEYRSFLKRLNEVVESS